MANWKEVTRLKQELSDASLAYWRHHNLFTFPWWLLLCTSIVVTAVWWKCVDRSRLSEIMLFGFILSGISLLQDVAGSQYMLWGYQTTLVPLIHPLIVTDVVTLPCVYTIIYQECKRWLSYLVAMLIASVLFSFLFEPLLVWLNIYQPLHWRHIYSLPIYIVNGCFVKWLVEKIRSKERRSS